MNGKVNCVYPKDVFNTIQLQNDILKIILIIYT